jgi:predicted glycosyltransferase
VVDIPISAPDDEILYERYRIHNRKTFRDACVSIFEQTYSSGELYNVLFHPERFRQLNAAIGDLVDHVQGRSPAVWCPTINELADWWQRRSAWHWQRIGDGRVRIEAPPEATVLIQGSASDSGESASQYIYRKYRAQPPAPTYPALTIGLSPRCPRPLEGFLHDEGFLVERAGSAQDHSIFLDRSEFRQTEARNLLDEIDGCKRPLLRLWRWPNGCRSAFCISADICAIDLKDFFERKRNFVNGQQRSSVQSQPLLQAVPQQSARSREPASLPAFASGRKEVVSGKVIWIDLDNTPHVPFFIPIIRELENRGCRIVLSARDAFQVCDLASQSGLQYTKIGRHYGKNMFLKVYGWVWRSMQLLPFALREKPDLALSHGARSQILLANVLRIPTVMIMDYEHSKNPPLCRPKWEIVPEVVMKDHLIGRNVLKYPGIKEDVYVPTFVPDSAVLTELGISEHDLVLTVRPPATEAHYHNPESEPLLFELMNWALTKSDARIVLLPRNEKQGSQLKEHNPTWFANGRVIIPKRALNGLNLLWHSDLVVSGGGTMNREAAALGVPVYSIFRGPIGAVDRYLQAEGRLVLISSVAEIRSKIKFRRRSKDSIPDSRPRQALHQIIDHVQAILLSGCEGGRQ